jgi:FkbM family methyltransferase
MNKNITSYSQNFEDILLFRCFKDIKKGFYIDVGSMDPVNDSVTKLFYDIGWSGVNIEASKKYFDLIYTARKRDLCIHALVSDSNKIKNKNFYDLENGLSSAIKPKSNSYNLKKIQSITLDEIFNKAKSDIHFLKIDVEGFELQVLQGWNLSLKRPWLIVIENNYKTDNEVEFLLEHKNYRKAYFDGLNTFYIHNLRYKDLVKNFHYPVGVQDNFRIHHYSSNSWCHYIQEDISNYKQKILELTNENLSLSKKISSLNSSLLIKFYLRILNVLRK